MLSHFLRQFSHHVCHKDCRSWLHWPVIDTEGHGPVRLRSYHVSTRQKEVATAIINELLDRKIIRPSISPWAAAIVLVKKKDKGDNRLCVDYRNE